MVFPGLCYKNFFSVICSTAKKVSVFITTIVIFGGKGLAYPGGAHLDKDSLAVVGNIGPGLVFTKRRHDTQQNDIQLKGTQHIGLLWDTPHY